ncbi:MAG: prolyl oligopeptidase family serine peptidase [Phycisphaera sp.]|nr:prolyl oligopeptidase family serine peptidase [Phycisphaera sp.]
MTLLCCPATRPALADDAAFPQTFDALWADVDPRRDPLDVQIVRGWEEQGVEMNYVVFTVGTFKGKVSRVAGYYGYPRGASANGRVPGLVHMHGGGQRAFRDEVLYYANRGYACLSVNWGGREMEDQKEGEPNTDWGAVDPTQTNVPGYINFDQGERYVDRGVSARNNNWYLLTLAGRRGLTFLEQRPEVDPDRLGVYGHSMGGNLTVYIAGTDRRVKVAAPSVGGTGFRSYTRDLLPAGQRPQWLGKRVDLYRATMAFALYAPHIHAPILWLTGANDFHGQMDDMYRTGALVPRDDVRYSVAPHLNHRFTAPFAVTRPLWIDQHLKGGPALPATPGASLELDAKDGVPRLVVRPDPTRNPDFVEVYYSIDPDPQARFWRSASVAGGIGTFEAKLPISSLERPLYAYASVYYKLDKPETLYRGETTDKLAMSSVMQTALPDQLAAAGVKTTAVRPDMLEDFRTGWRDWYTLNGDNPHYWQHWTRKVTDPLWRGPDGATLRITLRSERDNELVVVLNENTWRGYRGPSRTYVAVAKVGGGATRAIDLKPSDFIDAKYGKPLESWAEIDELGLMGRYEDDKHKGDDMYGANWQGPQPAFESLSWINATP